MIYSVCSGTGPNEDFGVRTEDIDCICAVMETWVGWCYLFWVHLLSYVNAATLCFC